MPSKGKKWTKGKLIKILLFTGLLIGTLAIASRYYNRIKGANIQLPQAQADFFIGRSDDAATVLKNLNAKGWIKNQESLKWLANEKNYQGKNVVPGKYILHDGMSNNELINHLRAGNGLVDVKVQFNQLRTIPELAGRLSKNIEADSVELVNWLQNSDSLKKYGFNTATITAMFIPNTYHVNWSISTSQLMQRMAKEFTEFWTVNRLGKARAMGLSQSEVVTLASIVYWETKKEADMPKVAGVYVNRLKRGMPLQADPTLIFALGDFSIKRVLNKDKQVDSPYNTYKYKGLPPGPIIIPPSRYVDAVLNYTQHNYIFFVAKEDLSGDSYFSSTYAQHKAYARRYQRALNKMGVRR